MYTTHTHNTPHCKPNARKINDITLAVIHYTGSMNAEGTINWFKTDRPKNRVSSLYVISRDGTLHQFGYHDDDISPFGYNDIHWHAGKSEWKERKWCNKFSIGYELVNTAGNEFTEEQYTTLIEQLKKDIVLCPNLIDIVGHQHISPGRKSDPGKLFDWERLQSGLIFPIQAGRLDFLGGEKIQKSEVASIDELKSDHFMGGGEDKKSFFFFYSGLKNILTGRS